MQRLPLDPTLLGKALRLGSVEGHMGGRELGAKGAPIAAALKWRYPVGAVWFVQAPTLGPREHQHPHTWALWFRPMWMEEMGTAPRKHPSGQYYGPQDALWQTWLAVASASPPCRLVYFEGKSYAVWGVPTAWLWTMGGRAIDNEVARAPLPTPRHVVGGGQRRGRGHAHRDRRVVGPPAQPRSDGSHAWAARDAGPPATRPPRLRGVRRHAVRRGWLRRGCPRPATSHRRRSSCGADAASGAPVAPPAWGA